MVSKIMNPMMHQLHQSLSFVVFVVLIGIACTQPLLRRNVDCSVEADGTACDDGNPYTIDDTCNQGVCNGSCVRIQHEGECVATCPKDLVEDSSKCVALQDQCGTSCLECAEDGILCARCTFDKYLEIDGTCASTCEAQTEDGQPDYTTELFPNPPGRYCNQPADSDPVLPSGALYGIIVAGVLILVIAIVVLLYVFLDRRKNRAHLDPALDPDNAARPTQDMELLELGTTTSSRDRSNSIRSSMSSANDDSDEPGQFKKKAWGSTRRSSMRSRSDSTRKHRPPPTTNATPTAVGTKEKDEWKKTLRKQARNSMDLQDAIENMDIATEHAIDSTAMRPLEPEERPDFMSRVSVLKKDYKVLGLILLEMKKKRDVKAAEGDFTKRARYQTLVVDLHRVLRLLDSVDKKKSNQDLMVPVDAVKLLDWAKRTLDRFILQRARLQVSGGMDEEEA